MMLANTRPIWSKSAASSRLVRNEKLNDHAAEESSSHDRVEFTVVMNIGLNLKSSKNRRMREVGYLNLSVRLLH